ncbi:WD40-repeat-containing domain protein [Pilobolus umbonatus]|nr:WD40-repeat-containing domain protein [Pilobolus umbonatus]
MSTVEAKPPPSPVYIFREHESTVNYVHLFNEDEYFTSCDADGWIIIWRMRTKRPILKWKGHEDSCLKVTVNNGLLISQGRDNMIHIWKLPSLSESTSEISKPDISTSILYDALTFCKVSCDQKDTSTLLCFPSHNDKSKFDIFDLTYHKWLLQNVGDSGTLRLGSCMAVQLLRTSNSMFVLAGYESGYLALWSIEGDKSQLLWHKQEHQEPILDIAADIDSSIALSSSADNQIVKYSLVTGDIIKKITIKKAGLVAIEIRADNKIFTTGGYDGRIRVFSVKSMKPLAILSYHKESVYTVAMGTKSNWLLGGSEDHRISLWALY